MNDAPVSTVASMSWACWPSMLEMRSGHLNVPIEEAPSFQPTFPISTLQNELGWPRQAVQPVPGPPSPFDDVLGQRPLLRLRRCPV